MKLRIVTGEDYSAILIAGTGESIVDNNLSIETNDVGRTTFQIKVGKWNGTSYVDSLLTVSKVGDVYKTSVPVQDGSYRILYVPNNDGYNQEAKFEIKNENGVLRAHVKYDPISQYLNYAKVIDFMCDKLSKIETDVNNLTSLQTE